MKTLFGTCPNCGGQVEILDKEKLIGICPFCKRTYVIENAIELSKVEVDKTNELKNLRELLNKSIKNNHIKDIVKYAGKIREIIPRDFSACYFYAHGENELGFSNYINDFYINENLSYTIAEVQFVLNHIIEKSDLKDRLIIEGFIMSLEGIDNLAILNEYKEEFNRRRECEEHYEIIERDVFICHRSLDNNIAQVVLEALEKDGNKCWISYRNLRPNDTENYWKNIENAIKHSKLFLVISSEDAMISKDIKGEINMARAMGKPRLEYKIDDKPHTSLFKEFFDGHMWVDAIGRGTDGSCINALCQRVFKELDKLIKKPAQQKVTDFKNYVKDDVKANTYSGFTDFYKSLSITDKMILDAEGYLSAGNKQKAKDIFTNVVYKNPNDSRAWLGLARVETDDFRIFEDDKHPRYIDNALKTAPDRTIYTQIKTQYLNYADKMCSNLNIAGKKRVGNLFIRTLPNDYRGYLCLAEFYTNDFKDIGTSNEYRQYYESALNYSPQNIRLEIKQKFSQGIEKIANELFNRIDMIIENRSYMKVGNNGEILLAASAISALNEKANIIINTSPLDYRGFMAKAMISAISNQSNDEYKNFMSSAKNLVTAKDISEYERREIKILECRNNFIDALRQSNKVMAKRNGIKLGFYYAITLLVHIGLMSIITFAFEATDFNVGLGVGFWFIGATGIVAVCYSFKKLTQLVTKNVAEKRQSSMVAMIFAYCIPMIVAGFVLSILAIAPIARLTYCIFALIGGVAVILLPYLTLLFRNNNGKLKLEFNKINMVLSIVFLSLLLVLTAVCILGIYVF